MITSLARRASASGGLLALAAAACIGGGQPQVMTVAVRSAAVTETVAAPGQVGPAVRQEVAAAVSGTVAEITAVDGAPVVGGQPVVRLRSEQVEAAQSQANSAIAAADVQTSVPLPDSGDATRAAVAQAQSELDAVVAPQLADARLQALAIEDEEARAAALAAIDRVEQVYASTRATLGATGEALALQQDDIVRTMTAAINAALGIAGAPAQAQADVAADLARQAQEDLVLVAPFDGTVELGSAGAAGGPALPADVAALTGGALAGTDGGGPTDAAALLRVGAPVSAGQVLFTVYDTSTWYVDAVVDEIDAPTVVQGQDVAVTIDAVPDQALAGTVERVAVTAATTEAGGVGFDVRVRLAEHPALAGVRVGMTAAVEITTRTVDADLVVPARALQRRDGQTVVLAVRGGIVEVIAVEVVALGSDEAAVAGDLRIRDRVVVEGGEDLTAGTEVDVR